MFWEELNGGVFPPNLLYFGLSSANGNHIILVLIFFFRYCLTKKCYQRFIPSNSVRSLKQQKWSQRLDLFLPEQISGTIFFLILETCLFFFFLVFLVSTTGRNHMIPHSRLRVEAEPHGLGYLENSTNNWHVALFNPLKAINFKVFPRVPSQECNGHEFLGFSSESYRPGRELFMVDHRPKESAFSRKARARSCWEVHELNMYNEITHKLRVVGGGDGKNAVVGRLKVRLNVGDNYCVEATSDKCLFVGKNTELTHYEITREAWDEWGLVGDWGFDYSVYVKEKDYDVASFLNNSYWEEDGCNYD